MGLPAGSLGISDLLVNRLFVGENAEPVLNDDGKIRLPIETPPPSVNPTLSFGAGASGIYAQSETEMRISTNSIARWRILGNLIQGIVAGSALIQNLTATDIRPTLCPSANNPQCGIGRIGTDQLSIICNFLETGRFENRSTLAASETSLWLYDDDNGSMEQVTVGAADSGGVGFKLLRIAN